MKASRVALLLVALIAAPLGAQGYFGQNQVQYDHFDWKVLETEHFLIHYYPSERAATMDAARMAERAYARLSRVFNHQFREKKPIVLFASRTDFGQNNVTGDLGEGTEGVTEALRHRMLMPFQGDYRSFEHVLTHEMVHEFQYDIFARGKAGGGLQALAQYMPPLWFAEGMAEYLSLGPDHPITATWVRDAALNGDLPSIEQMTMRPDKYFPYRYGESLWQYVASRWGDEVIGEIMDAVPSMGVERAFKRELGISLEELSDDWREAMQVQHLPQVATLERPRKFAQALLTHKKSGGEIFLAPALSSDGKYVAFLSNGSFLRGEVFIDLWLGDATSGKRIKRLVKSTTDPNFEELRVVYSQSSFSPDGRFLAFTAQRNGKDVLYLLDVKKRSRVKRFDLPLEVVTNPTWSPDGSQLAFSGSNGGISDLYAINTDGKNFRQLTNDKYGDLQPQWSPDGKTIALVSDRGETDLQTLRLGRWKIALYDMTTHEMTQLPGQAGMNLNPQWSPDGRSIAYVSDRTGTQNIFLYDLDSREHYQLTNVLGGVLAISEYSPVISWARQADRLAFTYYEHGDFTIWSVDNPRLLRKTPYHDTPRVVALASAASTTMNAGDTLRALRSAAQTAIDTSPQQRSLYRSPAGTFRPSERMPAGREDTTALSVAALLDSATIVLPDTSRFKTYDYHVGFQPEYVARPSIGYAQDSYGHGVFGGTTVILSDLIGNNRLALAGQVNGRVSEAQLFAGYTNLGHRLQYTTGVEQVPYYFLAQDSLIDIGNQQAIRQQGIARFIQRQVFAIGLYPLNRFTRFEFGAQFNNIDRATMFVSQGIDFRYNRATEFVFDSVKNTSSLNYAAPYGAYVSDNTLFGYTGPIMGRRYRFQVEPTIGSFRWVEYLADYRRYDPLLFNYLTFSTRVLTSISIGRDEARFPKYVGRPEYIRGYDRQNFFSNTCGYLFTDTSACSAKQLSGSRVAIFNEELRFPLVRRFDLGLLPISLPPLDGLVFYDVGLAWSAGQEVSLHRPDNFNSNLQRYPLRSYGFGLRLNLYNIAIVRWDYAVPLDGLGARKGFWVWSLGPSF